MTDTSESRRLREYTVEGLTVCEDNCPIAKSIGPNSAKHLAERLNRSEALEAETARLREALSECVRAIKSLPGPKNVVTGALVQNALALGKELLDE